MLCARTRKTIYTSVSEELSKAKRRRVESKEIHASLCIASSSVTKMRVSMSIGNDILSFGALIMDCKYRNNKADQQVLGDGRWYAIFFSLTQPMMRELVKEERNGAESEQMSSYETVIACFQNSLSNRKVDVTKEWTKREDSVKQMNFFAQQHTRSKYNSQHLVITKSDRHTLLPILWTLNRYIRKMESVWKTTAESH